MPETKRVEARPRTKQILYALSAGYCQYEGCDKRVIFDRVRWKPLNVGQAAHNVAARPGGSRGDEVRSEELADDPENILLLCYDCHKRIDEDVASHPEHRLRAMKQAQEERVELACGIPPDKSSHVLVFGSSVGTHPAVLDRKTTDPALLSRGRYPASKEVLEIQTRGDLKTERSAQFWTTERANLEEHYRTIVRPLLSRHGDPHVSVFAFAAQPLLVLLGALLSDRFRVDVFQRHREPESSWTWPDLDESYEPLAPVLDRPPDTAHRPALVISLSATITEDRISSTMEGDCSIWHVRLDDPDHDCIRSPADLVIWRKLLRKTLNEIKAAHGHGTPLHIFPAMPVSAAVTLGLVRQEKADMPFHLYDALPEQDFTPAINID